jgi:hypothetical protein
MKITCHYRGRGALLGLLNDLLWPQLFSKVKDVCLWYLLSHPVMKAYFCRNDEIFWPWKSMTIINSSMVEGNWYSSYSWNSATCLNKTSENPHSVTDRGKRVERRWRAWGWDSSVGIVMGYGLGCSLGSNKKFFSFLHSVQTSSGVLPISYPKGTVDPFFGSKAARAWT